MQFISSPILVSSATTVCEQRSGEGVERERQGGKKRGRRERRVRWIHKGSDGMPLSEDTTALGVQCVQCYSSKATAHELVAL